MSCEKSTAEDADGSDLLGTGFGESGFAGSARGRLANARGAVRVEIADSNRL